MKEPTPQPTPLAGGAYRWDPKSKTLVREDEPAAEPAAQPAHSKATGEATALAAEPAISIKRRNKED